MIKLNQKDREQFLIDKLEEFGAAVSVSLRRQARARGEHIPEGAIRALSYAVAAGNPGAVLRLSTTDPGRLIDMRRLNFEGAAISQDENFILEWAKRKGRAFFRKSTPGYKKRRRTGLSDQEELERIASAIIIAKGSQKRRRRKRRGWNYNKTVYSQIEILIDQLLKGQAEYFAEIIKEDLENFGGFRIEI